MSAMYHPISAGGVLVASASSTLREQVLQSFQQSRWPVQEARGGAEALYKLESGSWQLLFLDRKLPDLDAEELLQTIKRRFPGIEVVSVDSENLRTLSALPWLAPAAQRAGHILPSPLAKPNGETAECTPDAGSQPAAVPAQANGVKPVTSLPGMIGISGVMQRVFRYTRMVAPSMTTVLITGPTGTGKELVARAIHQLSPRAARPFVVVNCAAIPESLLESELFGHLRGAFTGAIQTHRGRILAAQGGTLFLDEVGELTLPLQAKLLRFLDQKEVQQLGSIEVMRADVRVVAATNADLGLGVDEKRFRGDLYYRLAAFPIELPSLADRREDIVPLAEYFLHWLRPGVKGLRLSRDARRILESRQWPGNVRELQQVMERALILAEEQLEISSQHLYFPAAHRGPSASPRSREI